MLHSERSACGNSFKATSLFFQRRRQQQQLQRRRQRDGRGGQLRAEHRAEVARPPSRRRLRESSCPHTVSLPVPSTGELLVTLSNFSDPYLTCFLFNIKKLVSAVDIPVCIRSLFMITVSGKTYMHTWSVMHIRQ